MNRTVVTKIGDRITVRSWRFGANRSIPNGPGQRYETVDINFCAGPQVEESALDVLPDFSLELYNGNVIAPDSQSQPGEFKTKGAITAGNCVGGPIVFQVEGGFKPHYVVFRTTQTTKWTVP